MADEFAKGLGITTGAGLAWMVLAGWYNTPSFDSTSQMLDPTTPEKLDIYGQMAVVLRDAFLVFAILGPVVFWFVIPAIREARASLAD